MNDDVEALRKEIAELRERTQDWRHDESGLHGFQKGLTQQLATRLERVERLLDSLLLTRWQKPPQPAAPEQKSNCPPGEKPSANPPG